MWTTVFANFEHDVSETRLTKAGVQKWRELGLCLSLATDNVCIQHQYIRQSFVIGVCTFLIYIFAEVKAFDGIAYSIRESQIVLKNFDGCLLTKNIKQETHSKMLSNVFALKQHLDSLLVKSGVKSIES